jgi:cob(I)alamin adenosyltransferase
MRGTDIIIVATRSRRRTRLGHRLSKIYTRTGDRGTTGLANGARVKKSDLRVAVCGSIDETNSAIGVVLAEVIVDSWLRSSLVRIQRELFDIGAELSLAGSPEVDATRVERLETELDAMNAELPPLEEFILPGGNRAAAHCHMARSICRRAERELWRLAEVSDVNEAVSKYLNRLSDLLFVAARRLARQNGGTETLWKARQP